MIKWKVRKLAESRGMNIGQLAEASEMAYSSALDFWHGRAQRVSIPVLNRLCNALGCTPCDIFEFTPGDMIEDNTEGPESEEEGSQATTSLTTGPSVLVRPAVLLNA